MMAFSFPALTVLAGLVLIGDHSASAFENDFKVGWPILEDNFLSISASCATLE